MISANQLAAIIYLPLLVWLVRSASIKRAEWLVLPSISWGGFMIIPLAVTTGWSDAASSMQASGAVLLGMALLAGDAVAMRYESNKAAGLVVPSRLWTLFAVMPALVAVAIMAWHVHLMPTIPLLEKVTSSITPQELLAHREASSKLLDIPKPVMWLFNQAPTVFGVVAIWAFWKQRKPLVSCALGFLFLMYAVITTSLATGFLFLGAIACLVSVPFRMKYPRTLSLATIILVFTVYGLAVFLFAQSHNAFRPDKYELLRIELSKQPFTAADCFRTDRYSDFVKTVSPARASLNRVIYRAVLTPVDVAHRWYLFFSESYNGKIGLLLEIDYPNGSGVTKRAPSNVIGIWAYQSRFPDKYIDSTSAYASADADAFAHFGFVGIAIVAFAILAWRVSMAVISSKLPVTQPLAVIVVFYVAALLPHASLQAIFISQGVLTLSLLILLVGWVATGSARIYTNENTAKS